MNRNVLLVLILFILLLFSFSTSALIPGDFNSDGKVDFEDLMLFALAYGSTPTDANWNPSCDLHTDNKIDFEDLMLFAMNYGEKLPVYNLTQDTYHDTIQEAIDASASGDTIEVSPGTYYENIVLDNKNITLRSTDPSNPDIVAATIIDGGGNDSVVKFTGGDASTLSGFTIQNGNAVYSGGGINVDGINDDNSPTITDNIITGNTGYGIYIDLSHSSYITDNEITGNTGSGIGLGFCNSATISNNKITDNLIGGVGLGFSSADISQNRIIGNTIYGISIDHSSANITDNEITGNTGRGIEVEFGSPNISQNEITDNTNSGITMSFSSSSIIDNKISGNTTTGNGGGILMGEYSSPTITDNQIEENTADGLGGGIYVDKNSILQPEDERPIGWGSSSDADYRQNIPPYANLPIARNTFFNNSHGGDPDDGADVYFNE